jgi:predicted dehydrogenase
MCSKSSNQKITAPGKRLATKTRTEELMKVAIVGCGSIAGTHFREYYGNNQQGVEVVACVDSVQSSRDAFARQHGIARTYASIAEVLDTDVDVLDLCTPPDTHPAQIIAAAKGKKDVICEKPLATSYTEAAKAVEEAEKQGIRVGVMQNYRWRPEYVDAQGAVASGRFGTPLMASLEALLHWDGSAEYRRAAERMLIIELTIHYVDLLRFLVGSDITQVYAAHGRAKQSNVRGETISSVMLHFENGAIGNIVNSGIAFGAKSNWGGETVVQLDSATLYINRRQLYSYDMYSPAAGGHLHKQYSPDLYGGGTNVLFGAPLRAYYAAWERGEPFPVTGRSNLNSLAATLACYESAKTRSVVDLEAFTADPKN